MTVAASSPTRPYSDRAPVLSQCHDGASGGSQTPRGSALAGEAGPASQLAASGRSSIGAFASAPTTRARGPSPGWSRPLVACSLGFHAGALEAMNLPPKGWPRHRRGGRRAVGQPAASRVRRVSRAVTVRCSGAAAGSGRAPCARCRAGGVARAAHRPLSAPYRVVFKNTGVSFRKKHRDSEDTTR